jgi:hypothetical protein
LHFENTSKFYEECASVESILKTKKYIENYEKSEGFFKKENSDIYKKLKEKQTFACENARKLPAFDKQQPEQPAAEIYKIIVTLVQNKR